MNKFIHNKHSVLSVLISFMLCLLLVACGTDIASALSSENIMPMPESVASVPQLASEPEPQPQEQRVRFSAVGDNLIHEAVYRSAQQKAGGEGYDFSFCYENIQYFFEDFDVNWINQETLVNDEIPADTYPCFSTPGQLGQAAYDAGWRVFAMSNNHTYDKGAAGVEATLRYWQAMPEDVVYYGLYTGREDDSGIALQEVNGITIAYVAFCDGTNGISIPADAQHFVIYTEERAALEHKVRRARELADVVVVSVHWGVENSHNISDNQRYQAQSYADWGADVIIGTHPHVVQGMEWLESGEDGRPVFVAYSLGNFLSAQSQANQLIGLALTFDIVRMVQPDGTVEAMRIENVQAHPVVTQYEYNGGSFYQNSRTYLLRDYTEELAKAHNVRNRESRWGAEYILSVVKQYVPEEYLALK